VKKLSRRQSFGLGRRRPALLFSAACVAPRLRHTAPAAEKATEVVSAEAPTRRQWRLRRPSSSYGRRTLWKTTSRSPRSRRRTSFLTIQTSSSSHSRSPASGAEVPRPGSGRDLADLSQLTASTCPPSPPVGCAPRLTRSQCPRLYSMTSIPRRSPRCSGAARPMPRRSRSNSQALRINVDKMTRPAWSRPRTGTSSSRWARS